MKLEFAEIVEMSVKALLEGVHTVIPGRVVSYNGHDKRTATVQPVVRLPMVSGPLLDIPPIDGVPVAFPSTAAGSLLFPLAKGDGVLILFSEVGIGRFLSAKAGAISDPGTTGRHALSDAIAIPGLWSVPTVPQQAKDVAADSTVLYSASGAVAELGAKLGLRNGSGDLRTELEAIWDAIADIYQRVTDIPANLLTSNAAVGTPCTVLPSPLPPAPAWWAAVAQKKTAAGTSKTNVGKLLK